MTDVRYGWVMVKHSFFGLIRDERTQRKHMFYTKDLRGWTFGDLQEGDRVIFSAATSTRGPRAKQVYKRQL